MPIDTVWIGPAGSQDWSVGANWSGGVAPANGDTAWVLNGTSNIDAGLNQSGVTLANLFVGSGFTGTIGSASAYLQIGATNWVIGLPAQNGLLSTGSQRIKINFGVVPFTSGSVLATASSGLDSNLPPVRVLGVHANNVLNVNGGRVGVAVTSMGAETSTIPTIRVTGGYLTLGAGMVQPTTLTNNGGNVLAYVAPATIINTAGEFESRGSAAITNLTCGGNTKINNRAAGATITTSCEVLSGGTLVTRGNPAPITITPQIKLYEQSALVAFSPQQITASGGYKAVQCGIEDITVDVGDNPSFTLT